VNVIGTLISGNSAGSGGGGGISNLGTTNVSESTINGNIAGAGAGILNRNAANVKVTNTTITSNTATATQSAGAIVNDVGGQVVVTNSTITDNRNSNVGGVLNSGNAGDFSIKSTIIAVNVGGTADAGGSFTSGGFNLIGKKDGSVGFNAPADQTGTVNIPLDPKLDPAGFANHGGNIDTIRLLCGSPALDRGTSNGLTGNLTHDQRGDGFPRTFDDPAIPNGAGSDGTDIGALEWDDTCAGVPTPTPTPTTECQ
jgi:hypothetical protein